MTLRAIIGCREDDSCLPSAVPKTFRALLLIAMTFSLVAGQALPVMACGKAETRACGGCCAKADAACCEKSNAPARSTPSQIAPSSVDLKQAVVPVLICLGMQPARMVPPVSARERALAQLPIQRRLEVTCIRLI